jgi:hypothetical protein
MCCVLRELKDDCGKLSGEKYIKDSMMVLDHLKFSYFSKINKTLWIKAPCIPKKASKVFEAFEAVFMEL